MSPDPYSGSYDMNNPQSLNRYSYVLNNPLAFTDRLGLDSGFDCGDNCVGVTGTPDPDPCGEDPSFCSPSGPGSPTGNALPLPPIPPPAPNKPVVLPNPCPYQGRALPPSAYAQAGRAANGSPVNFTLDVTMGFPAGDYLDPQPLASGNTFQNQAYGNYTFGVYMQAAGVSLSTSLSGANAYAFFRSSYPSYIQRDSTYSSLPAANVANIINGYNAQANGTTCHN